MGKLSRTAAIILGVLMIAAGTVSAQEKKQVEKKIRIVTVDEKGAKKDTTIITSDTIDFTADRIIVNAREGKMMQGMGKGRSMVIVNDEEDNADMMQGPMMRHMMMMNPEPGTREGVNYHITVDGVTVNIRAPKEKTKEADLILQEAKNILMKK